jgi:hypothetical protein
MNQETNILGCFVSSYASLRDSDQKIMDPAEGKGELFRSYIWGKTGICDKLKKLKHEDYGKDLVMILFQFYVNPVPYLLENLKEIENYRRKEKAIGIPIIVSDENFFNKSEKGRMNFLKYSIVQKLDLLAEVITRKKLDTDIDLLRVDLDRILRDI